jgi:hypothetical protein
LVMVLALFFGGGIWLPMGPMGRMGLYGKNRA